MYEQDLNVFIDSALQFFGSYSGEEARVETPFLREENSNLYDYCGVISVSGNRRGSVYFSTTRDVLETLLRDDGEENLSEDNLNDFVGEIANIVSGSARKQLGPEFMITVPTVLKQEEVDEKISSTRAYIIPIVWRQLDSMLVIDLES